MPALVWGTSAIAAVVEPILTRGHEIQLHLHPEWLKIAGDANPLPGRTGRNMHQFTEEEQVELLEIARDHLMRAGAPAPTAFRAGNYGANDATLRALARVGIRYDSSHVPGISRSECRISLKETDQRVVEHQGTIEVPAAMWHAQPHPDRPGDLLPGTGYATYSLQVVLPKGLSASNLALHGRNQGGAVDWRVLSHDGTVMMGQETQGKVGKSAEEAINFQYAALFGFPTSGHQSLHLMAHMSNYDWARGGFWLSPYLGSEKEIRRAKARNFLTEAIIFGICLITALYHLIVFFQRREDASNLYFACLCGAIAIRQWLTGRFFEELGVEASRFAFDVMMSAEWGTMVLMVLFAALFIETLVPSRRFKRFVRVWCVGLGLLVLALLLFTPPITYSPIITSVCSLAPSRCW